MTAIAIDRRPRGRIVVGAAVACIVCGLIATISILLTPRPAISSAPSVDVSDLAPGTFKFARDPVEGPRGSPQSQADILFIRHDDGELVALHVPLKDGVRHAPDTSPRMPRWPCRAFEVMVSRGFIECTSDVGVEPRINRWDLKGRGIAPTGSRLHDVSGHEDSGVFLIHP